MCVSCNKKSRLESLVDDANKTCPIDMGLSGKVSSFSYENGEVTVEFCLNEDVVTISSVKDDKEAAREGLVGAMSMLPDDLKAVYEEIVKAKASLVYKYVGDKTKDYVTFKFTTAEIANALNAEVEDIDYASVLEQQLSSASEQCPRVIDVFTTLDSVTLTDENAIYNYTINEDTLDLSTFESQSDNMRQYILNGMYQNMSSMRLFLTSCVKMDKGLRYRYVGCNTGGEFTIDFDKDMLQEILK